MRADFVANASHELRTPLSSLIGFIETLKTVGAQDPEASARFLGIMNAEALRMVRLIDDLLSLSRIEMDRHLQPSASVALPALFESLLRSMQPQATARAVCFDVALEGDLPAARGDRDQLLQVFMNLLSNSIKYGRQGGTVRITAKQVRRIPEVGSPGLCITVSDEGDGIPSEHLPRLTERFYRVDSARSRRMGGTGLGLAIVKHIVSRHRGHLAIDSVLGQGTSVAVYLPAADPVEEGQEPTQQAQAIASAAQ
ncbi:MAG: sensor histidine kinase [Rhodothalassiaceae bacterium]